MKVIAIPVTPREKMGTSEARRLRRTGRLPAILYGMERAPLPLSIEGAGFLLELGRGHRMFELRLEDKTQMSLVKDVQYDAFGDKVVHVDFHRVDDRVPVTVSVRLEFVGEPAPVSGAVLDHVGNDVAVRCLPREIPDRIVVPQAHLTVGQHIEAGQLELPPGVELADNPHKTIASFHYRHVPVEAAAPAAAEEAAEPVVLKEKKPAEPAT